MPTVSVVLLNWNGVHLLPTCLASLSRQTFQAFEIIVPDNGSTDGSLEFLAEHYPEVQVIRFSYNTGFCLAVNAGMRASRGEFILSLNNDTELEPSCLAELLAKMRSDPRIGICAPKMLYYDDPSLINSAGHACAKDGVVVDIGRGEPDGEWFSRPREVLGACAGAALYRREMLRQIGLFDPDFFISYEDIDLGWRAQWAGWSAWYVPSAVVLHREGVTRQIRGRRSLFLAQRNIVHVWTKDWPLRSLLRRLPAVWRGWISRAEFMIEMGHPDLIPSAVWSTLVQTPRMLSRRRQIRRTQTASRDRFEQLIAQGARQTGVPPED
jgi:hypothetical protein